MKSEHDVNRDDYQEVGWYHVVEARGLLRDLEAEGVRFFIRSEHSDPVHGDPVSASMGGSFGSDAQVLLHVHEDDMSQFREVHDPEFLREKPVSGGDSSKPTSILRALVIVVIVFAIGQQIVNWLQDK